MPEITELQSHFERKILNIFSDKKIPKTLAVAVSGGCDSLALTILLNDFCNKNKIKLLAFTVDHKMRQISSSEALELNKLLRSLNINHEILEININDVPQKNIEANLRNYRYELLIQACEKAGINNLFLGHQLEDIAENFLIRLFRGSGLDGLSAISEVHQLNKINLIRPLLDATKDDLKAYLKEKNIVWFEDESNSDEKFLRNKIRSFLNSFEESQVIHERIKNAAEEISQTRDIFDKKLLFWARKILVFEGSFFKINLEILPKLDEKIALKILAFVAMEVSQNDYKPRLKDLIKFYNHLIDQNCRKRRDFYGCTAIFRRDEYVEIRSQKMLKNGENECLNLKTILRKIFKQ